MQRVHIYLDDDDGVPAIQIDIETVDELGGIVESDSYELYGVDEISSAIDSAWNEARNRGLPLLVDYDVINLPG